MENTGNTVPTTVALKRCGDYRADKVLETVKNAIDELGGIDQYVKAGDRVLLKPNLLVGRPAEKHVNTHPAVVQAVIRLVKKAGGKPVIGDSPALPATGNAVKVAVKCGIADVARKEGVDVVDFNNPVEVASPSGATFKKFKIDQMVLDSDVVINLPKLKSHGQMTLTMGVKNIFGGISKMSSLLLKDISTIHRKGATSMNTIKAATPINAISSGFLFCVNASVRFNLGNLLVRLLSDRIEECSDNQYEDKNDDNHGSSAGGNRSRRQHGGSSH